MKKLTLVCLASVMSLQAGDLGPDEVMAPQSMVHQYADENFLVELGITRDVARVIARDLAREITGAVTEFMVRPLNSGAANASKTVCLDLDIAGHSAFSLVDKGCDACNTITKWWRG